MGGFIQVEIADNGPAFLKTSANACWNPSCAASRLEPSATRAIWSRPCRSHELPGSKRPAAASNWIQGKPRRSCRARRAVTFPGSCVARSHGGPRRCGWR